MCHDCTVAREELWAAQWDIRSLEDELEATERKARRLRAELRTHTCVPDASAATEGAAS